MASIIYLFLTLFALVLVVWLSKRSYSRANAQRRKALLAQLGITEEDECGERRIAGFFHPYCNAGGGGERVLWTAIAYLQREDPQVVSVVYTGDIGASKEEIVAKVKQRFGISLDPHTLAFIYLRGRWLVEDTTWPRFTLLGQSVGSMLLSTEALQALVPDIFLDTMGYAFTYPVVRYLTAGTRPKRVPIIAYIHYPTISSSMFRRVSSRESNYANSGQIASSAVLSTGKLIYYRMFASMYIYCLRTSHTILSANSSWTAGHIDSLLSTPVGPIPAPVSFLLSAFTLSIPTNHDRNECRNSIKIIHPPCDTKLLTQLPLEGRRQIILSIAQFRPEKDHPTQLRAYSRLLAEHPEYADGTRETKLVLVGSSRNDEDGQRVLQLKALAADLGIQNHVQFIVNALYPDLLHWLGAASIGISTMVDEHFGINIVEFMAAGLIPVVHASGGPMMDIVTPFKESPTGFHAHTVKEFASALHKTLRLRESHPEEELAMRRRARASSLRFEQARFEEGFRELWDLGCVAPDR